MFRITEEQLTRLSQEISRLKMENSLLRKQIEALLALQQPGAVAKRRGAQPE